MKKDLDGFRRSAEPLINDDFLDWEEEKKLMEQARAYGLDADEAQQCLGALCESRDTVVERLATEDFRRLVECTVSDRFLDQSEQQLLETYGLEAFKNRPNSNEVVKQLIDEVLTRHQALSEEQLRASVGRRLTTLARESRRIRADDWQELRAHTLRRVAGKDVDFEENDISSIIDSCLEASMLRVKRPTRWTAWLAGIVGAPVLAGLLLLIPGNGVRQPLGSFPACDADCEQALKDSYNNMIASAEDRRFTNPPNDSLLRWHDAMQNLCAPLRLLENADQEAAKEKVEAWKWCDHPGIETLLGKAESFYATRAEGRSGAEACDAVDRCLTLLPSSARCQQLKAENRCSP